MSDLPDSLHFGLIDQNAKVVVVQAAFACQTRVSVAIPPNWEQCHRSPTGKVLLLHAQELASSGESRLSDCRIAFDRCSILLGSD
jgi:hypothetical protein